MINKIIEEIDKSLESEAYLSALSLVLILPDICGKAEYNSNIKNKERYINWFDEYIGKYEQSPFEVSNNPYLSGEVVYQLRCCFMHEGNPNINKNRIKNERNKIDKFILLTLIRIIPMGRTRTIYRSKYVELKSGSTYFDLRKSLWKYLASV